MEKRNPMIGLGVTTAMAAVMLSGCAGNPAPQAAVSAADAQLAMANGEHAQAIQAAEAAVQAEPRNASYRMTLGNAYLEAGRFASASTSFEDAIVLGDTSPRAALSLALALTGQARYAEAGAVLSEWENRIAPSDLGLALALAGQPERGIHILTNAVRGGDNTVKTRQNLAYAYAVAGRWREARMMAAQDIPAHQVGDRMAEWAQLTHADAYQARVAGLLGVPANTRDAGQPVHLALVNSPDATQLAFEASAPASGGELAAVDGERMSVPVSGGELPSVGAPSAPPAAPATSAPPVPTSFAHAFGGAAASAPPPALEPLPESGTASTRYTSDPVVQTVPATATRATRSAPGVAPRAEEVARPSLASAPAPAVGGPVDDPTHLVQLGSFSSEAGAQRAWGIYVSRYPELADREMVITQARVNGRNYWRVSAGGFDRASSRAMCSRVDSSSGDGCISWAASSPLPGAIDTGMRLARR